MTGAAGGHVVAAWRAALAEMAGDLDAVERALTDDAWESAPRSATAVPDTPVPPELEPLARRLATRSADLASRLRRELRATGAALAHVEVRRSAARNYRKSATTASAAGRGDD